MAKNTNNQSTTTTKRRTMATVSTRTHGEDALPLATIGTLDGITVLGQSVLVRLNEKGTKADVVTIGKQEQVYVANKPRPTDATSGPVVKVNGKARKHQSFKEGAFPAGPNGPNRMAREITTVKLTDATITLTTGETRTLEGVWYLIACVKHDEKRNLRHEILRRATKSGDVPVVRYING